MNNHKFKVGDKVRVRSDLKVGHFYGGFTLFKGMGLSIGAEGIIKNIDPSGWLLLDGSSYWWTAEMLEPVSMTKEEWLTALIKGAVGIQSGNTDQRWRYYKDSGRFEVKNSSEGSWRCSDVNNLWVSHSEFSLVQGAEMTIEEIEKKLGVTNLKIVK